MPWPLPETVTSVTPNHPGDSALINQFLNTFDHDSDPADGMAWAWDADAGQWVPTTVAGVGGGATELAQLNDVDLSPAPSDGDVLVYDAVSGTWVPGTPAAGGTDDQSAAEVAFTPVGDVTATNLQSAVEELDTKKATPADVQAAVDALLSGAPGALDTLDELAQALGDDADFAGTVTASLANKSNVGHAHSDVLDLPASTPGVCVEVSTGVWVNEPPAGRTNSAHVWEYRGPDDPAGANGISTPANIRSWDDWTQVTI